MLQNHSATGFTVSELLGGGGGGVKNSPYRTQIKFNEHLSNWFLVVIYSNSMKSYFTKHL